MSNEAYPYPECSTTVWASERDSAVVIECFEGTEVSVSTIHSKMRFAKVSMRCTLILLIAFLLIGLALLIPGAVLVSQNPASLRTSFSDSEVDQKIIASPKFTGGYVLLVLGLIFLFVSISIGCYAAIVLVSSRRD
nr:unnamed protein product [Spirometra erinaceieuropaei]